MNNKKTDVGQIPKIQSEKDICPPKPSIHGTPLPPKTTPRTGK